MKRWLVLAPSLSSQCGYGVLSRALTDNLSQESDLELDIFEGGGFWPGRQGLKSEGIINRKVFWLFLVAFDFVLLNLLARKRYTGVLVLVEPYSAAGWLYARQRNIPCVVVQHGTYAVKLPRELPFFKRVMENINRAVAVSHYTRRRMEEEGIKVRVSVVPLGVNRERFHVLKGIVRQPVIVFVGNLKSRKGIHFLLDALSVARDKVPGIRLKVVGRIDKKSTLFEKVEAKIASEGLDVEFTGPLSHDGLLETYAIARLNALPSKSEPFFFEGFGLVHLEANACGTLTVGTVNSGNEDAIKEGFGYLVHYGDINALAEVIVETMKMEPYPQLALDKLRTWKDVARDYMSILTDVESEALRFRS